ncbi:MAG: hypothetical protein ABIH59_02015 [archaeon]
MPELSDFAKGETVYIDKGVPCRTAFGKEFILNKYTKGKVFYNRGSRSSGGNSLAS